MIAPLAKLMDCTAPKSSDRECLESWARHRDAASLQTLVGRYLVFVHSSALRRTGDAAQAAEVTRAGVPCSGPARAQAAEENRARGLALPRHSRRLPEAHAKALWQTAATLALDFPQAGPGVAAGRAPVDSRRAPNGSRAGTIANEAAERGVAVRISKS